MRITTRRSSNSRFPVTSSSFHASPTTGLAVRGSLWRGTRVAERATARNASGRSTTGLRLNSGQAEGGTSRTLSGATGLKLWGGRMKTLTTSFPRRAVLSLLSLTTLGLRRRSTALALLLPDWREFWSGVMGSGCLRPRTFLRTNGRTDGTNVRVIGCWQETD